MVALNFGRRTLQGGKQCLDLRVLPLERHREVGGVFGIFLRMVQIDLFFADGAGVFVCDCGAAVFRSTRHAGFRCVPTEVVAQKIFELAEVVILDDFVAVTLYAKLSEAYERIAKLPCEKLGSPNDPLKARGPARSFVRASLDFRSCAFKLQSNDAIMDPKIAPNQVH